MKLSLWASTSLREKCLYSEFFWSVFSRIRTVYRDVRSIYTRSGVLLPENSVLNTFDILQISNYILDAQLFPQDLSFWAKKM